MKISQGHIYLKMIESELARRVDFQWYWLNTNSQVKLSLFSESVYLLGLNIKFYYEVKATKNQTIAANSKSKCINELYITITKYLGIIHKPVNWSQIYI